VWGWASAYGKPEGGAQAAPAVPKS
jgi:hypothetical protein